MPTSIDVAEAIYAKLAAGTAITALLDAGTAGIHYSEAPENASHPLLLYYEASDVASYGLGKRRTWTEHRFTVEAITEEPSFRTAKQIAALVDAELSDSTLTVSGVDAILIERIDALPDRPETVGGRRFNHSGFDFRVKVGA